MATKKIFAQITSNIIKQGTRSAWSKGVEVYALELVEQLEELTEGEYFYIEDIKTPKLLKRALLNGAYDWSQYSWGGCALIYNSDIAKRLCTPSELKRTREGALKPNSNEEWLDTQARALYQACERVMRACAEIELQED